MTRPSRRSRSRAMRGRRSLIAAERTYAAQEAAQRSVIDEDATQAGAMVARLTERRLRLVPREAA